MLRKLIKPNLRDLKAAGRKDGKRKPPPPYKTHAENYYYIKQMNNHTALVIELINGETYHARLEWYDEKCIKIKQADGLTKLVFKSHIKCIFKDPAFHETSEGSDSE